MRWMTDDGRLMIGWQPSRATPSSLSLVVRLLLASGSARFVRRACLVRNLLQHIRAPGFPIFRLRRQHHRGGGSGRKRNMATPNQGGTGCSNAPWSRVLKLGYLATKSRYTCSGSDQAPCSLKTWTFDLVNRWRQGALKHPAPPWSCRSRFFCGLPWRGLAPSRHSALHLREEVRALCVSFPISSSRCS
ncbi:hypothetical protein IWZ01DRAFT_279387 [Phyllosticta capitalensis]